MTQIPTRFWTPEEWERIKCGYRSRGMDEKWDVFVEDDVAYLHRSWTGRCVFEASFSQVQAGWHISSAIAETERVRDVSAQRDKVVLELVLSSILLGEPAADLRAELVRLSMPTDHPAPPAGAIEHNILGLRSNP